MALAQLDMAFKIDPGSIGVLRDLGVLAFETNDLDRARRRFVPRAAAAAASSRTRAIDLEGGGFLLSRRNQRETAGDKVKAVQMFERAIENDIQRSHSGRARTANELSGNGVTAVVLGRRGRSRFSYLKASVARVRGSRRAARPARARAR